MAWAQRAAILKHAKHPAAAKLYLNWWLSTSRPSPTSTCGPSAPTSHPTPGYRPIWEYPNANLDGFDTFMADRALVERFRQQLTLYVGEVTERRPRAGSDCTPDADGPAARATILRPVLTPKGFCLLLSVNTRPVSGPCARSARR